MKKPEVNHAVRVTSGAEQGGKGKAYRREKPEMGRERLVDPGKRR